MNANHQPIDGDEQRDARLTAYALGQLDEQERAAVEAELAASEKAREEVRVTRILANYVYEATCRDPSLAPSPGLRQAVEERLGQLQISAESSPLASPPARPPARSHRRLWGLLALAACLLVAAIPSYMFLTGFGFPEGRPELASAPLRPPAKEPSPEMRARGMPSGTSSAMTEQEATDAAMRAYSKSGDRAKSRSSGGGMGGMSGLGYMGSGAIPAQGKPAPDMRATSGGVALPAARSDRDRSSPARRAPARAGGLGGFGGQDPGIPQAAGQVGGLRDSFHTSSARMTPMLMPGLAPGQPADGRPEPGAALGEKVEEEEEAVGPVATPGTEQYQQIVENRFVSATERPLSTFSIDVDTASYANVRRFLRQGSLPPRDAVRIEEMLNYFPYHDPQPKGEEPFSVNLEAAQCPWNNEHRLVRIGLAGREIDRGRRGPSNLVFLLDVSGSMDEPDKLPLVKEAMKMLVRELTEDDRVAIVTYAQTTGVRLESTNAGNKPKILDCIDSLAAGGSTNGGAGIQLAYEQAVKNFRRDGANRVILATDGDLNVGITEDDELVRLIRRQKESGVFLTVLGVGTGNLKDSKLEKLADKGNGAYAYLDSVREARRVLVEQISGSLVTIAKDVKIQVEFNPAEVASYRLIGYENRRLAARDFDDDRKDAGEIGAGHHVTALYEIVPARSAKSELTDDAHSGQLLTLQLRYKPPKEDQSKLLEYALRDSGQRFGEASADFQFAAAVASFGMILRNSPYRGQATLKGVEEIVASALRDDPGGYRAEFLDLVRGAELLRGQ